jgi:MGT family glycosyltransferase
MSKIIFIGAPAQGHVNPTLPLVQELVQRGEQVLYYNQETFREQIERTGATMCPYPATGATSERIAELLQHGNLANTSTLILEGTEKLLPFILRELEREQPDVVIFDSLALWGKMATTQLNLPSIASITHFVFTLAAMDLKGSELFKMLRQFLPQVPRLLVRRLRLQRRYPKAYPAKPPLFPMRGDLNIVFTLRDLQPPLKLIDETFRFVGPSINPHVRSGEFPFEISSNERVIYISLGTIHNANLDFYRACFEAFRDYPSQFILSAGRQTDLSQPGEIPANFIVRPTVPQLEVLQQTSVFITHGGMNSIHEGLYYGVPLIVVPQQFEQLLNGRTVEKRGACLVIDKQVMGQKITAEDLRQALDQVLSRTSYSTAAEALKAKLHESGGYHQAADEIQRFISSRESE